MVDALGARSRSEMRSEIRLEMRSLGNARQAREVMHCADVDSSTRVFIAAFEHFAALNPAMELDVCKECAPEAGWPDDVA